MPPKHKTAAMAANKNIRKDYYEVTPRTPFNSNSNSNPNLNSSTVTRTIAPGAEQPHRDDDLEEALAWIEKGGRLGAKGLAKKLPHTALGLVDGSIDPVALADTLVNCLKERMEKEMNAVAQGTVRLANGNGREGERALIMDLLSYVFTEKALPPLTCDDDDLRYEFYSDLKESLRQVIINSSSSSESGDVLMTKNVKQAFDETCRSWEGRLTARFFKGSPGGAFRRSCPLFNASLEDFDRVLENDVHTKMNLDADRMDPALKEHLAYDLRMAAHGIAQGLDQVTKTCWECEANLKTKNECSGCNVALYCGRKCQVKAWKGGHKKACQNLNQRLELWMESLNVVDAAHESGMLHGIQLHADLDYRILSAMYSVPSPYALSSCGDDLGEPSMKAFYENLGRVIRDEWWFYDNTSGVAEYKEFVEAYGKTGDEEGDYFLMLSIFLAYDYFKAAATGDGAHDPEVITSMFDSTSCVMGSSEAFGMQMPAWRFLEMYNTSRRITTSCDRLRIRRIMNEISQKAFRDCFHKAGLEYGPRTLTQPEP
jgi:hypothetical protein